MSRKNAANPGSSWTSARYAARAVVGQLGQQRRRPRASASAAAASCSGVEAMSDGAGELLEVAPGDGRVGVVRGDDLALLGELEPAVDRARRAAEDRPVRRPAAAPDGAAAAVEQRQLDAVLARDRDERLLGAMEHPGRGEEPGLLVRVGVAEHHLLAVAARREVAPVAGSRRSASRIGPAAVERVGRLEERDDVEARAGRRRAVGRRRSAARRSTSVASLAAAVNETTNRRHASSPNRAWMRGDRPERREHLAERHARARPRAVGVRGRRPVAPAPRARPDGPRCAGGSRARRGGTRTSRPASAARRPRPRRPAPGRPRRAPPGPRPARRRARRRPRSGRSAGRRRRSASTRVRRSRSAMNPNRWRYGSSGKRRRSWRSVSGRASASRARRLASGRGDARSTPSPPTRSA